MRPSAALHISSTGIRGIVGEALTPQLVTSFASAFGTYRGPAAIVVGTDTRPSRGMVTEAAVAGLLSVGCTPVNVGIVPTPTLQHHVRSSNAAGGICITASHHPMEWSGLWFFGADGVALSFRQLAELTDLHHQGVYDRVPADRIQEPCVDLSAIERHRATVLALVNVDLIRSRKFPVVVDCCNGSGSMAAPRLLQELGCEVFELNTEPTGLFPRNPNPVSENIEALSRTVESTRAVIGFAQDADADRVAMVDEEGVTLGEDTTIALAARHFLRSHPGPLVVSLSTSRLADAVAEEAKVPLFRSRVGEIHVFEKMQECGAGIGGEGSGRVIVSGANSGGDSFIAMALILEMLALDGRSVSEVRRELPLFHMVKTEIPCLPREVAPALRLLRYFYRNAELDLTDGLKILWPERWIHVRGSRSEPVLRIVAEADSEEGVHRLVDDVMDRLRPTI